MGGRRKKQKFVEEHRSKPTLQPLTRNQDLLIRGIRRAPMVITTGYSGTGKTYVPTIMAADMLTESAARGGVDKLILTRPNVQSGKSLGFRPGDLHEKLLEWFAEIITVLRERLGAGAVDTGLKTGTIELVPFETMRGRSFNNAFVILDEAQNTTPHEAKMFTTRLGEGTKTVVNGDVRQSDLRQESGLKALLSVTANMDVPHVAFRREDIVRSELCKAFIENWMEYENES